MNHIPLFEEFMSESRRPISKDEIFPAMYKPKGDYFFEPIDKYTIRLHLTSSDAADSIQSLSSKFDVKRDGPGHYGSAYIVKHK